MKKKNPSNSGRWLWAKDQEEFRFIVKSKPKMKNKRDDHCEMCG